MLHETSGFEDWGTRGYKLLQSDVWEHKDIKASSLGFILKNNL